MTAPDNVDDLDDLDDLLDDFDDDILSQPPGATVGKEVKAAETKPEEVAKPAEESTTDAEGSTNVASLLKEMEEADPELSNQLQQFLGSLAGEKPAEKSAGSSTQFQHVISETVNRIKTSGDEVDKEIENETKNDELLATLMRSLDIDPNAAVGGSGGTDDVSKLLVEMLDKLSGKAVLYEPMHDLYLKFGPWLEDPKHKTDKDYAKYQKQYGLVKSIVDKFQDPRYDDNNRESKDYINEHLEELQELGMPPKELVNDDLSFLKGKGGQDLDQLQFGDDDVPEGVAKELEEGCKNT